MSKPLKQIPSSSPLWLNRRLKTCSGEEIERKKREIERQKREIERKKQKKAQETVRQSKKEIESKKEKKKEVKTNCK